MTAYAEGKMPSGQPAGRRRYKMPALPIQLPASAGAAAAGTATAESAETSATAAESATTASGNRHRLRHPARKGGSRTGRCAGE